LCNNKKVSVLAFGTRVRGVQTKPKSSDFSGEKILGAPSFGGDVKPSVPCRKFTACKRTQIDVEVANFGKILGKFLAHSSTFSC